MAGDEKFRNIYRIPSARWADWDYSRNAAYFITICTAGGAHDFGEVVEEQMCLTALGRMAESCWEEIPAHFPFVDLGEFVVMPNHVHGIVIINKHDDVETQQDVEPQDIAALRGKPQNRFGPQSLNLASIVRGYKIGVTKFARANRIPFAWQPRYYDRVIRNEEEYDRIQAYILANPQNWQEDEFLPAHR